MSALRCFRSYTCSIRGLVAVIICRPSRRPLGRSEDQKTEVGRGNYFWLLTAPPWALRRPPAPKKGGVWVQEIVNECNLLCGWPLQTCRIRSYEFRTAKTLGNSRARHWNVGIGTKKLGSILKGWARPWKRSGWTLKSRARPWNNRACR